MVNAPRFATQAEYARHRDVSRAMISKLHKQQRLVLVDGKVDVQASDAMLAQSLDPSRGGKGGKSGRGDSGTPRQAGATANDTPAASPLTGGPPAEAASVSYSRVRTFRESFVAKTAEVEYRKMIGELVEREAYARALTANMGAALQRLDSISARLGARVAGESDVRKCMDMIDDEVMAVRQEVADIARAMAQAPGGTRQ
jgi:hypothetical protein